MKTVSNIIAWLFHPLLFPTYGALLILGLNPNMFGYFGEKIHLVWMLMMKGLGMIDSLKMETSKERIIPFVAAMTFYLWTAWMFKANVQMKIAGNQFIFYMMAGACISVSVSFFMNSFSKISLHTLGAGSLVALLLILVRFSTYDLRLIFVGAILLAGIIGSARLILKAHNSAEVFSGYFIGFVGQFLAFNVISRFL